MEGNPMNHGRILLVEDDPDIVEIVKTYLEHEGYSFEVAFDGLMGLQYALDDAPDLILLDWNLPGMSGLELMKRLRREQRTPIIMLTARTEEVDRVLGLEVGADDYLTKPFSPRELVARVKAMMRRVAMVDDNQEPIRRGPLLIEPSKRQATLNGVPLSLSVIEFDLLLVLAKQPGRAFSRDEVLTRVWGDDYMGVDRVVDVHISNLRQKVQEVASNLDMIHTLRGVGYTFAENFA
jgi:two-component system, OmpR family, alkaline phosphatase synthesis response regulator PhoP